MGNVGNVNAKEITCFGSFNRNCVVDILCVWAVNGEYRLVAEVKAVGYLIFYPLIIRHFPSLEDDLAWENRCQTIDLKYAHCAGRGFHGASIA